jgi:hypothetical protein
MHPLDLEYLGYEGAHLLALQAIDLEDLGSRPLLTSLLDLIYDARSEVILHEEILDAREGLLHCRSLRDDVDAVCPLINHILQASHLSFNELEPSYELLLRWIVVHARTLYPQGV